MGPRALRRLGDSRGRVRLRRLRVICLRGVYVDGWRELHPVDLDGMSVAADGGRRGRWGVAGWVASVAAVGGVRVALRFNQTQDERAEDAGSNQQGHEDGDVRHEGR